MKEKQQQMKSSFKSSFKSSSSPSSSPASSSDETQPLNLSVKSDKETSLPVLDLSLRNKLNDSPDNQQSQQHATTTTTTTTTSTLQSQSEIVILFTDADAGCSNKNLPKVEIPSNKIFFNNNNGNNILTPESSPRSTMNDSSYFSGAELNQDDAEMIDIKSSIYLQKVIIDHK